MVDFLQMVLSGIAVGSSYALMGLGMVLIYKASETVNFAQGEFVVLPAVNSEYLPRPALAMDCKASRSRRAITILPFLSLTKPSPLGIGAP